MACAMPVGSSGCEPPPFWLNGLLVVVGSGMPLGIANGFETALAGGAACYVRTLDSMVTRFGGGGTATAAEAACGCARGGAPTDGM